MRVSDYLFKKAAQKSVPLSGSFELTPVCNFSCKMCYVRRTPEQLRAQGKQLIHWQQWLELAQQCKDCGTLYLLLTGGEPFLYPGFQQLYTKLHQMGFILSINTNGTLIDEQTVQWLKQVAPSRVNVTLYGSSPDTYARICGNPNGYEKAVKAIEMLRQAGIPVVVNASMISENASDLEDIIDFGRSRELNTRIATYMFPPLRRDQEAGDSRFTPKEAAEVFLRKQRKVCSAAEYDSFCRDALVKNAPQQSQEDTWGTGEEYMRCRAGRSSFWVSWDGTMSACGMIDFPLKTQPFQAPFRDCWLRLTDKVRTTPVLQGCANCSKRDICGVCVAMIYAETGTVDQKAPYLCQMSDEILACMQKELEEQEHEP